MFDQLIFLDFVINTQESVQLLFWLIEDMLYLPVGC